MAKMPDSVFIFDGMRMRSHLFFRYLSTSSDLHPYYHPFLLAAFLGEERWAKGAQCSAERKKEIWEDMLPAIAPDTFDSLKVKFEADIALARSKNMTLLANEHIFNVMKEEHLFAMHRDRSLKLTQVSNPTHIPDQIFNTLSPIILIRNPILQVNSTYRSCVELGMKLRETDEDFEIITSLHFSRCLFDMFTAQGRKPIVVDGEDVVYRTDSLIQGICERLGMDPEKFSDKWDPTPEEQMPEHPMIRMFTLTIHASAGIERPADKPALPSIGDMVASWMEKYGEATAAGLKSLVLKNMADYEYLKSYKV